MEHTSAAVTTVKTQLTERAISATTYAASGSALYFGLTANEIAAFVGATVAVLSLIVNVWFRWQHLKAIRIAAKVTPDELICKPDES